MTITYVETASWSTVGSQEGSLGCRKDLAIPGAAVGDKIIVFGGAENYNFTGGTRSVYDATGSTGHVATWTEVDPATTFNNDVDVVCAYGTVTTAGTVTVSAILRCLNTNAMGVAAYLIPAAEWTGSPVVASFVADTDGQVSLAVAAASNVFYFGADWSATSQGTTNTPSGAANDSTQLASGLYSVALRHWGSQASGTRNYGPSGLSGIDSSGIVIALPTAGGATNYTPSPADALGLTDARTLDRGTTKPDPLGLTDSATLARSTTAGDALGMTDSATASLGPARTWDDPVGMVDAVSTVASLAPTVADSLAMTDSATAMIGSTDGPYSLWPLASIPAGVITAVDYADVVVGTEFFVTSYCNLMAISYLHVSDNPSLHTCALFSTADGVTGTNLTGWVAMPDGVRGSLCVKNLDTPVLLTPGVEYVVAVQHTAGEYPVFAHLFDGTGTTIVQGPLSAPSAAAARNGSQGRYTYTVDGFPDSTFNNAAYFSDVVVYTTAAQPHIDLADPLGLTDAVTGVVDLNRPTGDALGMTDSVSAVVTGVDYATSPADPMGMLDAATTTQAVTRQADEPLGLTDAVSVVRNVVVVLTDSLAILDTDHPYLFSIDMPVDDVAGMTDSVTYSTSRTLPTDDPEVLTDSVLGAVAAVRGASDPMALSDAAGAVADLLRSPGDPQSLTDSLATQADMVRATADRGDLTDYVLVEFYGAGNIGLTDLADIDDVVQVVRTSAVASADTLGMSDEVSTTMSREVVVADALSGADTTNRVGVVVFGVVEDLGLTDAVAAILLQPGSVSTEVFDPAALSDQVASWLRFLRSSADKVWLTDTVVAVLTTPPAPPHRGLIRLSAPYGHLIRLSEPRSEP